MESTTASADTWEEATAGSLARTVFCTYENAMGSALIVTFCLRFFCGFLCLKIADKRDDGGRQAQHRNFKQEYPAPYIDTLIEYTVVGHATDQVKVGVVPSAPQSGEGTAKQGRSKERFQCRLW